MERLIVGSDRLRAGHLHPHPRHFAPSDPSFDESMRRHDAAMAANRDGYLEPATGRFVFTAACLARRPCCGSRCRHCPWLWPDK